MQVIWKVSKKKLKFEFLAKSLALKMSDDGEFEKVGLDTLYPEKRLVS